MTGPVRTDIGTPLTAATQPAPQAEPGVLVEKVGTTATDLDDGRAAAGGEEHGPPLSFEALSNLSDDELEALARTHGIDTTTTGMPKGVLVQEIHQRISAAAGVPVDPAQQELPTQGDAGTPS